jgi:hypothetical protein
MRRGCLLFPKIERGLKIELQIHPDADEADDSH